MLEVQKYLKEKGIEQLKSELGIEVRENPNDNRMLLNYSQINSPKTNSVVRECRGLCLDKNDFSLISRSFFRFFNYTECPENDKNFNWDNCITQSKEDGTLLNVYYYNDEWKVCTRGSFGDIPFYPGSPTPEELFFQIMDGDEQYLDRTFSYSFELCSLHNKIVREYRPDCLYLLSCFRGEEELSFWQTREEYLSISNKSSILLPKTTVLDSISQVENYIKEQSIGDRTWEGVVLRDNQNIRIKLKSPTYIALHRIGSDKKCLFHPKYLIDFILENETDELLCYYGEVKPKIDEMTKILDSEYLQLEEAWELLQLAENRKEFAECVPKGLRSKGILFTMFNQRKSLPEVWRGSRDYLLKCLFGG